jgi:PD-(D/E)XK nuclease superfamily protein
LNEKNWILPTAPVRKAIHAAATDTITQSEIMLRASCPRKWLYRCALMLERKGLFDINLSYGSIMHRLLEDYYRSGQKEQGQADAIAAEIFDEGGVLTPSQIEELELAVRKVQIAFEAYCEHYRAADERMVIVAVEKEIAIYFEGLNFAGKIDLVSRPNGINDGIFIWDYKTSFRLTPLIVDSWTFRFQFLWYAWLWWHHTGRKPDGIMVQGLLKPQLRPKKGERQDDFLERIREEMFHTRENYFYRERIPLVADALERFEREMLSPHVAAFRRLRYGGVNLDTLAMAQNTGQCHIYGAVCPYLQLCKDGWAAVGEYSQREKKHMELSGKPK